MNAQTAGRTPVDFASRPLPKSLTFPPGWRLGQAGTMTTTISLRLAVLGVALAFIAAIIFGAF
jgi:ABC-type phosphate/phosphonate transport system permease subunit